MQEKADPRPVTIWLLACCAMVFFMALLGAITRLTESGLSITRWDPVMGALPPLNDEAWRHVFAAYQATPQYQLLHRTGMELADFKTIFFWEWLHRLWGRLIGAVFALPLLVFWLRGQISRRDGIRFSLIFLLGGLQGFIGWFMVQSGLEDRTSVSPIRLALHLAFALALYALLLWLALAGKKRERIVVPPSLLRHGWTALACLALTITWGALVAGLQAGQIYNTWPLMDGDMLPALATELAPWWRNLFENPVLAQFVHRWLGPLTLAMALSWVWRCRRIAPTSALTALGGMAALQVGLGLATLLSHTEIVIALLHQAGAISLLTLFLYNLQRLSATSTGHERSAAPAPNRTMSGHSRDGR